jgi:cell division protein FtsQ
VKFLTGYYKRGNRKKKWNVLESIFFVLIVIVSGYVLLQSPIFEVHRVLVRGNEYISEEQIISAANIGIGENIFKVDLNTAKANLKLISMVKEVRLDRSFPSSVVINVLERKPLGLLPAREGFIKVDEEAIYLQEAKAGTPGLPVLTGIEYELPNPGQAVQSERLRDALEVITGLPASVVASLSEVHTVEDGQIILYTLEGIQCRLGLAMEIPEKGAILEQLLQQLSKQKDKINYIDLSCAGQPVVLYKVK